MKHRKNSLKHASNNLSKNVPDERNLENTYQKRIIKQINVSDDKNL